ncbi:MAG: hypothetical protein HY667_01705 [Chloroflexi bacterium]|nr:hypothetical protein [Chloroflexota bacterium]
MAEIAYPGTDKYSMAELVVIVFARQLAGPQEMGTFGGGGRDNLIPLAAAQLLRVVAAGQAMMGGGNTLPLGTWDPRLSAGAEYRGTMMDVVDAHIKCTRLQDDRNRAWGGGIQIDKYGNLNMIGVGKYPRLTLRGPGTVGTIWNRSGSRSLYTQHHSKRILVDKVDYISGPGWMDGGDSRYKAYNGREGPWRLFTPICVFDFTEDTHAARLVSVHPGYTVKDILDNTGFTPVLPEKVLQTTPPTDYELETLRTRVDRGGVLRKWTRMTVG